MQLLAEHHILSSLKSGGYLQGDVKEMVEARVGALFMPHGKLATASNYRFFCRQSHAAASCCSLDGRQVPKALDLILKAPCQNFCPSHGQSRLACACFHTVVWLAPELLQLRATDPADTLIHLTAAFLSSM